MKVNSIHKRILFSIWLLLLCAFTPPALYLSNVVRDAFITEANENAIKNLDTTIWLLQNHAPFANFAELDAWTESYGATTGQRLSYLSEGRLSADSNITYPNLAATEDHSYRPEVVQALQKGFGLDQRLSTTLQKEMIYVAKPVSGIPGIPSGILRLSLPVSEVRAQFERTTTTVLVVLGLCFAVAGVISYLSINPLVSTIQRMSKTAQAIGTGDYSQKIRHIRWKELRPLAFAINDMAKNITRQLAETEERKEQLEAIFHTIRDGVILLRNDGTIISYNQAAGEIFSDTLKPDKTLLAVTMQPEIQRLIDSVQTQALPSATAEISLANTQYYLVTIVALRQGKGEMLAVLHDLTEQYTLEQIRRDFVANVSHELKTPLTSIKGYTEILLDGDTLPAEKKAEYLQTILRNANHMDKMVVSLLTLARAEHSQTTSPQVYPVEVQTIIKDTVAILTPELQQKNITLRLPEESELYLLATKEGLTEVIRNLMDNAVKYTPQHGNITISLAGEGAIGTVSIEDDGLAIPPEAQQRVFERFYRLGHENASGKSGSAGLGLAICKRIVKSFDGSIWVKSPLNVEEQTGTAFCFSLHRKMG